MRSVKPNLLIPALFWDYLWKNEIGRSGKAFSIILDDLQNIQSFQKEPSDLTRLDIDNIVAPKVEPTPFRDPRSIEAILACAVSEDLRLQGQDVENATTPNKSCYETQLVFDRKVVEEDWITLTFHFLYDTKHKSV